MKVREGVQGESEKRRMNVETAFAQIREAARDRAGVTLLCRLTQPAVFTVRFFPDFIVITETALDWAPFLRLWR
jgi:hypothetical protein